MLTPSDKNHLRIIISSFFLLILFVDVSAQTHQCGFNHYMDQRYEQDPSLLEMRSAYEDEIQAIINSRSSFFSKTIPVVVHIIYNDSYSNISNAQVNSALIAINEDFNADNSDYNNVVSAFSSIKSDVGISFALASIDPDGNYTSGITRTESDFTDYADENVKSLVMWDTDMYLNVWVVDNIESGAGAYAYYPGTAPAGAEGIVCRHSQFGTMGTSSNYNFASTTMTHEIGHYLNLAHTWGDSNDPAEDLNCNYDDGVSDTPNTIGTSYGCNTNQSTCGSLDNVQNYMDYSDCTNMFSNGQRSRMHAALHSSAGGRVNLWQHDNLVATGLIDDTEPIDDTECNEEEIIVQINTGSYANEISWIILDSNHEYVTGGGGEYSNYSTYYSDVCLPTGSYTFNSIDSWGDGWNNGGSFSIRDCDNSIILNNNSIQGEGEYDSFVVSQCPDFILGCTNPLAINFNAEATDDDGSCVILGCTDTEANNYNPLANQDDNSCIYYGCQDASAINFDAQANEDDGSCEYFILPSFFNYELTGSNHTVVCPVNMVFSLFDGPISNFDVIGVFYENDFGEDECAGYIVWDGTTNSIAAQGDDATTDEIDGFGVGVSFKFKVWDYSESILLDCIVSYNDALPNQQYFSPNGISSIISGHQYIPITSQEIILPEGWSIFSTYLNLENMDIGVALNSIEEQLVIVKDYLGMAYLLEWNYNGIGDVILGHAYQVKVNQETVLEFEGDYTFPNEVSIVLPVGWSLLGYLRTNPADCVAVFELISDEIVLVKDYLGNAYLPNWNFNGIGNLEAGQGYQIKMNSSQILQYNSNEEGY